jgi:hypothetical protein
MPPPLDPESDKGRLGKGSPSIAKFKKQKQRYSISVETQAAFWVLAPTFLIVALLAIGGRLRLRPALVSLSKGAGTATDGW